MTNATGPARGAEEQDQAPPDIAVMRETVALLMDPDAMVLSPAGEELDTLTLMMRGHLEVLAPEVEQAARQLEAGSTPRYTALGCVWEARSRLESEPSARTGGHVAHARRLARVLGALCDQYETIGGRS